MENQLPLIQKQLSYKIVVKSELENKIRFLCKKLPTKEYSGTLFYKVKGTFENNDLVIEAIDFYLQDVGVSTFTQFKNDVGLASYMVDHDLIDCFTGLMHSHNQMAAFFSGTDVSTLQSEGNDANHFVSLIVNNAGEYKAAITRKITNTAEGNYTSSYNTFENALITTKGDHYKYTSKNIEYFNLDVIVQKASNEFESELNERLEALLKDANSFLNAHKVSEFKSKDKEFNDYSDVFKNFRYNLFDDIPEISDSIFYNNNDKITIKKELLNKHIAQIITGNLFAYYKKDLDLRKWINNMDNVYNRRFPQNKEYSFAAFQMFAENLIEFLNYEIHSEDFKATDDVTQEDIDIAWADQLHSILTNISSKKPNKYIDYYLEILEQWIIL